MARDTQNMLFTRLTYTFICLNLFVYSLHVGLFHMIGYFGRTVVVGGHRNSNLTHCISLGPALLLCGYKLCLADPDLSALLD